MMRKLVYLGTGVFWLAMLAFWAGSRLAPPSTAASPAPVRAERPIALAEVTLHASSTDCWMAIDGKVYDLTAYLPEHPSNPSVIVPWCGREASEAYRTKTRGRRHSPEADRLLPAYRIGVVAEALLSR